MRTTRHLQKITNRVCSRLILPRFVGKFVHTSPLRRSKVQEKLTLKEDKSATSWEDSLTGKSFWLEGPRPDRWWTGAKPFEAPGLTHEGYISSLKMVNCRTVTREELLAYFENTWALTEVLFSSLKGEEAFYIPPFHDLRHPMIFYYGHTACFYINKLIVAGLLDKNINTHHEDIFEQGVDEMQWDDLSKNHKLWPSVEEVMDYRKEAYAIVKNIILTHPAFDSLADQLSDSPFWSILMCIEHEHIHLETSSVLIRELPIRLVQKPKFWPDYYPTSFTNVLNPTAGKDFPLNEFLSVSGSTVRLGKLSSIPYFGWDNEYGKKIMDVQPFQATKYKITNGEFLAFMKDGGYGNQELWCEKGWQWRCFRNTQHPAFWTRVGAQGTWRYKYRHIFDWDNVPWSWPVEVCKYEADAYCRWLSSKDDSKKTYRIMTEAEHHTIRDESLSSPDVEPVLENSGKDFQGKCGINLAYSSPNPVDAFPPASTGFHDVFGSVWEWMEDYGSALPGYQNHPFYIDFSLPCFDGLHSMILGGSFISTGDEATKYGRYYFRSHFQQHSGFRVVQSNQPLVTSCMDNQGPFGAQDSANPFRSLPKSLSGNEKYDEDVWLGKYIHLHFPPLETQDAIPSFLPKEALNFPLRCANLLIELSQKFNVSNESALDIGCAVGGSSFPLASYYQSVHAMDISEAFIDAANELKENGEIKYQVVHEGHNNLSLIAAQDDATLRDRVTFEVGDAMALSDVGQFDAVLMANVLCRLPEPRECLRHLGGRNGVVRPGGILMLTTPFSWDEDFTPKDAWIGGSLDSSDNPVSSSKELQNILEDEKSGFELIHSSDMPLLIRNHYRHYEFPVARATVWRNIS